MSNGLDELRRRYPWPATLPESLHELTGWFAGPNRTAMLSTVQQSQIIVELGSFQGLSSKWFCENMSEDATLICIDHWEGSDEHHRRPDWEAKLATLYGTFLENLSPWQPQVIPMKTTTLGGIVELKALGIIPDMFYVDASHDEESVYLDATKVLEEFPDAELFGDDWPHDTVRLGVVKAARRCGLLAVHGCSCWQIHIDKRLPR